MMSDAFASIIKKSDYRNGNYPQISSIISRVDWCSLLTNRSMDEAYNEFLVKYNEACLQSIPLRKKRVELNLDGSAAK